MSKNNGNGGFALFLCFGALGVAAVIAFITYLLPLCGVEVLEPGSKVAEILKLVLQVVLFLGVLFGAFAFAGRHGVLVKILTAIFTIVFLVAIVLYIINITEIVDLSSVLPGAGV